MEYKIRKSAYLKTPLYSWSVENDVGGSFSVSGTWKSKRACINQMLGIVGSGDHSPINVHLYDVDGEGRETLAETIEVTR